MIACRENDFFSDQLLLPKAGGKAVRRYLDDPTGTYQRAMAGDDEAFVAMVEHFQPKLEAYLQGRIDARIAGRVAPSDVLQELYLRRLARQQRSQDKDCKSDPASLPESSRGAFAWLRRIATRRLIDCHRRYFGSQKRDPAKESSVADDQSDRNGLSWVADRFGNSPSADLLAEESRRKWMEWMERLSPANREVLKLKFFEKLSTPQIAERLGLQEATVSKRIVRGLNHLREILPESTPPIP